MFEMSFLFYMSVILPYTILFLQILNVMPAAEGSRETGVYRSRRLLWSQSQSSDDILRSPFSSPGLKYHMGDTNFSTDQGRELSYMQNWQSAEAIDRRNCSFESCYHPYSSDVDCILCPQALDGTATPVRFENLDVVIDVRSSTAIGHVVYFLSTSKPTTKIHMMTRSNLFELERNQLKTIACLPAGHMEVLEFQIRSVTGLPDDTGSLSLIILHTRPTILIPDFAQTNVDRPDGLVDILHVNYSDPGDCVQFFCFVTCINDEGTVFRIEDDTLLRADVRSLSYFVIYELIVTCSDTPTNTLEGSNSTELRVKFIPGMVQTMVNHLDTTSAMTTVPVQFENLNASVEVNSSVNVGDVIYNLSTSVPDAIIVMLTQLSLFYLDRGKLKTNYCLPAGYMQKLDFIVRSPTHPRADIGFLNITVKPTRPTFLMPDFVEVYVDPNKDDIDVIGINYVDPGDCVEFFCDLLNHRDEFWIEDDTLLRADAGSLRFNFDYELIIICADDMSQSPEGSSTAELSVLFLPQVLHRPRVVPMAVIIVRSSVEINDTVYILPGAGGDDYYVWGRASQNFHLDSRTGTVTTLTCLTAGQNELLQFHVLDDSYGNIGPPYFLDVTVEPTVPVYTMPDVIEVRVDVWKDIVDVFTIGYEYPGDCVYFRCSVSSFTQPIKQFWVLSNNTVQTTGVGISSNSPVYEVSVVCSDTGTTIIVQENFFNVQVLFQPISINTTTHTTGPTAQRVDTNTVTIDVTTQPVDTTTKTLGTTNQTVGTTTWAPFPRTTQKSLTNLDVSINVTSNQNVGDIVYGIEVSFIKHLFSVFMVTNSQYFEQIDHDIVVKACLPVGHTEYLQFEHVYAKRSTTDRSSTLNITVIPTTPVFHVPRFVDVYLESSHKILFDVALDVTEIDVENDGDCVPFLCSISCDSKQFWMSPGSPSHHKYMIQTNSNGISFETVYFLDIKCFDAQTLGVMDAFVTQAKTVVRFIMTDGSTITEKPTTSSSESFPTSVFKASSSASVRWFANSSSLSSSHKTEMYTPVETTNKTTASSTGGDAASVSTTITIPVTFSSSGITTPIKGVFMNLDANISLSSSQSIGDVVYTVETYDPHERIAMMAESKYFTLIGRDIVTSACLPAGHSESLQFQSASRNGISGRQLSITVIPTFPVINSPVSYAEFTIATRLSKTSATDTVNVTEIEFEDPGSCVSFQCSAICYNHNKNFTVTGTSVSTSTYNIKTNFRYHLYLTCGDGNIQFLTGQFIARRKLSVVFIDVTTKQLPHSTESKSSSVSTVTFLRFHTSVSTETSKYIATKRDRKSSSVAHSYLKMVSKLATRTPTSVHLISWGKQSDPSARMTTSTSNYITTSMLIAPSRSGGLTNKRTFLDERSKLVLLTSVCGGVAGLSVLVALVAYTYKRGCGNSAITSLTRDDSEDKGNSSAYTLDSSSANSTSRLIGGSALTPIGSALTPIGTQPSKKIAAFLYGRKTRLKLKKSPLVAGEKDKMKLTEYINTYVRNSAAQNQ